MDEPPTVIDPALVAAAQIVAANFGVNAADGGGPVALERRETWPNYDQRVAAERNAQIDTILSHLGQIRNLQNLLEQQQQQQQLQQQQLQQQQRSSTAATPSNVQVLTNVLVQQQSLVAGASGGSSTSAPATSWLVPQFPFTTACQGCLLATPSTPCALHPLPSAPATGLPQLSALASQAPSLSSASSTQLLPANVALHHLSGGHLCHTGLPPAANTAVVFSAQPPVLSAVASPSVLAVSNSQPLVVGGDGTANNTEAAALHQLMPATVDSASALSYQQHQQQQLPPSYESQGNHESMVDYAQQQQPEEQQRDDQPLQYRVDRSASAPAGVEEFFPGPSTAQSARLERQAHLERQARLDRISPTLHQQVLASVPGSRQITDIEYREDGTSVVTVDDQIMIEVRSRRNEANDDADRAAAAHASGADTRADVPMEIAEEATLDSSEIDSMFANPDMDMDTLELANRLTPPELRRISTLIERELQRRGVNTSSITAPRAEVPQINPSLTLRIDELREMAELDVDQYIHLEAAVNGTATIAANRAAFEAEFAELRESARRVLAHIDAVGGFSSGDAAAVEMAPFRRRQPIVDLSNHRQRLEEQLRLQGEMQEMRRRVVEAAVLDELAARRAAEVQARIEAAMRAAEEQRRAQEEAAALQGQRAYDAEQVRAHVERLRQMSGAETRRIGAEEALELLAIAGGIPRIPAEAIAHPANGAIVLAAGYSDGSVSIYENGGLPHLPATLHGIEAPLAPAPEVAQAPIQHEAPVVESTDAASTSSLVPASAELIAAAPEAPAQTQSIDTGSSSVTPPSVEPIAAFAEGGASSSRPISQRPLPQPGSSRTQTCRLPNLPTARVEFSSDFAPTLNSTDFASIAMRLKRPHASASSSGASTSTMTRRSAASTSASAAASASVAAAAAQQPQPPEATTPVSAAPTVGESSAPDAAQTTRPPRKVARRDIDFPEAQALEQLTLILAEAESAASTSRDASDVSVTFEAVPFPAAVELSVEASQASSAPGAARRRSTDSGTSTADLASCPLATVAGPSRQQQQPAAAASSSGTQQVLGAVASPATSTTTGACLTPLCPCVYCPRTQHHHMLAARQPGVVAPADAVLPQPAAAPQQQITATVQQPRAVNATMASHAHTVNLLNAIFQHQQQQQQQQQSAYIAQSAASNLAAAAIHSLMAPSVHSRLAPPPPPTQLQSTILQQVSQGSPLGQLAAFAPVLAFQDQSRLGSIMIPHVALSAASTQQRNASAAPAMRAAPGVDTAQAPVAAAVPAQAAPYFIMPAGGRGPFMQPHMSRLDTLSYVINFVNPNQFNLGPDNQVLDRHHMFATGIPPMSESVPVGASQRDIDKYSTTVQFVKNDDDDDPARCTVCMTDFETGDTVRSLSCTHAFHVPCIDRWLSYNKKCPNCRLDVDVTKNATDAAGPSTSATTSAPVAAPPAVAPGSPAPVAFFSNPRVDFA